VCTYLDIIWRQSVIVWDANFTVKENKEKEKDDVIVCFSLFSGLPYSFFLKLFVCKCVRSLFFDTPFCARIS